MGSKSFLDPTLSLSRGTVSVAVFFCLAPLLPGGWVQSIHGGTSGGECRRRGRHSHMARASVGKRTECTDYPDGTGCFRYDRSLGEPSLACGEMGGKAHMIPRNTADAAATTASLRHSVLLRRAQPHWCATFPTRLLIIDDVTSRFLHPGKDLIATNRAAMSLSTARERD